MGSKPVKGIKDLDELTRDAIDILSALEGIERLLYHIGEEVEKIGTDNMNILNGTIRAIQALASNHAQDLIDLDIKN